MPESRVPIPPAPAPPVPAQTPANLMDAAVGRARSGPFGGTLRGRLIGALSWMAWLVFPIVSLLADEPPPLRIAWALGLLALFISITVPLNVFVRRDLSQRQVAARIALITAIAIVLSLADRPDWAPVLFAYVAAAAGLRLPVRAGMLGVLVLAGVSALVVSLSADEEASTVLVVAPLTTFGVGAALVDFGRLISANQALIDARAEVARLAVADERLRFARDVHDVVGHSLSVITLKAQVAGRLLDEDPERARDELRQIEQVARGSLSDVRETVSGYRRPTLAGELGAARTAFAAAGIELAVEVDEAVAGALDPDDEATLAWAVREGVTNVLRHAGAGRVVIRVAGCLGRDGGASVEVVDDGDGRGPAGVAGGRLAEAAGADDGDRDRAESAGSGDVVGGNGLRGLAERAAARGGSVAAGPADDGSGFRLRVAVGEGAS